jgi:hypothetical protein
MRTEIQLRAGQHKLLQGTSIFRARPQGHCVCHCPLLLDDMRLLHPAFANIISQIASLPHEAAFAPH